MSGCKNCETSMSIFSNCFTLNIKNERIQEIYDNQIREKKYVFLIYLILSSLFIISCLIATFILDSSPNTLKLGFLKYFGYVCVVFQITSFVLYFIQLKCKKVTNGFLYINMTTVIMSSLYLGKCLTNFLTTPVYENYSLLAHSGYLSIIVSYIIFADNNFLRVFVGVIINLSFLIFSIVGSAPDTAPEIMQSIVIDLGVSFIIHLIFYYYLCRIAKESLFYREKLEMEKNWIYEVLNHWNSGVIVYM